jgi:hypothetical protein
MNVKSYATPVLGAVATALTIFAASVPADAQEQGRLGYAQNTVQGRTVGPATKYIL